MRSLLDRLAAALAPAPDDDRVVAAAPPVRGARPSSAASGRWRARTASRSPPASCWPRCCPPSRRPRCGCSSSSSTTCSWPRRSSPLAVLVPAMVGLALLGALLSFGDEYAATWVGERFTLALRTKLFAHLQRLEPDALDRRRHGDVLARLTGDVHAIETLLLSAAGELVQAAARRPLLRRRAVPALVEARARLAARGARLRLRRAPLRPARPPRRARAPPPLRLADRGRRGGARQRRARAGRRTRRSASSRASGARTRASWRPSWPARGSPACSRR